MTAATLALLLELVERSNSELDLKFEKGIIKSEDTYRKHKNVRLKAITELLSLPTTKE